MFRWGVPIGLVVGALVYLWLDVGTLEKSESRHRVVETTPPPDEQKYDARPYIPRKVKKDGGESATESKIDTKSEEFSTRLDVSIPDKFRSNLARCERSGMDPDAKITFTYMLQIHDGAVWASDVRIAKSDLENPQLEQCMLNAVQNARWLESDLPDFSEEQDLFIRIRSLNKYLSVEEQKAAKAKEAELATE